MLKPGSGFFAMWNGIAPEAAEDFALMHTRDHLGEHLGYLGAGGILSARRFGEGLGSLPPYFAFYQMAALDRLKESATVYQVHETNWFKALRELYRDRIAHHCRVLASAGAGSCSAVATFLVDLAEEGGMERSAAAMDGLTRLAPVTAAHIGAVDWTVPIRAGGIPPACPAGDERLGVVVVESYSRLALAEALEDITGIVAGAAPVMRIRRRSHYAFSYALGHDELGDLKYFRRDQPEIASKLTGAKG